MNKRQIELLNFCGYKIDSSNRINGEKDCIASMAFDEKSKMFSIKIKSYTFNPGDYESIEMFTITVNHMLGLIFELNSIKDGDSNEN